MKLFIITLLILVVALLLLAIQTLFHARKRFPNTHIGGQKELKKRGIYCAQTADKLDQSK